MYLLGLLQFISLSENILGTCGTLAGRILIEEVQLDLKAWQQKSCVKGPEPSGGI